MANSRTYGESVLNPRYIWFVSATLVYNNFLFEKYLANNAADKRRNSIDLHVKWSLMLSKLNENYLISTDFRKTLIYEIS
jgi:hypothetical protein